MLATSLSPWGIPGIGVPVPVSTVSLLGSSSMVLAAVLSVLALSIILLGGGVVLLRGRGMRYFQKG